MNRIFRDTTYDHKSTLWKLGFCTGIVLCVAGPSLIIGLLPTWMYFFGLAEIGSRLMSATGSVLIFGGIGLAVVLSIWYMRRFDFTTRYRLLILNEQDDLFYADMTRGALLGHYIRQIPDCEKRKYRPKGMYYLFGIFSGVRGKGGRIETGIVRDIELFRYNQAHPFVEPLLAGDQYEFYCEKILRTENVQEKRDRVEALLITQTKIKRVKRTVRFYRTMPEYECVLQMLRKREKNNL